MQKKKSAHVYPFGATALFFLFYFMIPPAIIAQNAQDSAEKIYKIGDTGPAGGIIFYDRGTHAAGWRYLEAAPPELEFYAAWGAYDKNIKGTELGVGCGKTNTELILAYLKIAGEMDKAAQITRDCFFGGYGDWFIPSKDELDLMYRNLKCGNLGGFENGWYWSSSQSSSRYVWYQRFGDGVQSDYDYFGKFNTYAVRPVRSF